MGKKMNVRSMDEFYIDIKNSPVHEEQAGRDFEATIRLRQDVESYFDLHRRMSPEDAKWIQKNIASRITCMDLAVNPNKAKNAAKTSGLGMGEIISRWDRQYYVELVEGINVAELCSHIDDGAIYVARSLGWSEDQIMNEFVAYDREQMVKEITPQVKADSQFLQNMMFQREGYSTLIQPEDLPYYLQQEYDQYEYRELDRSAYTPLSVNAGYSDFHEEKSADFALSKSINQVSSDIQHQRYSTASDEYGFDEPFDDDDDYEI